MSELRRSLVVHAGYDTPTASPRRHSDIEDEYVDEDTSDVQDPETSEFELKSSGSSKKRAMKASKTPQKRRKQKSSLQSSQRRNVDNAIKQLEPNADRPFCVVSRAFVDFTILEYAHVLPAATPFEVLDKLEWVWNMKHGTLDVDTPRNIHPLDVGLHRYFDHTDKKQHDGWFWLPDVGDFKPILDMYDYYTGILAAAPSQHAKMRRNPDEFYKDQKVFKYRFVPFPAMRNSWAVRRLTVPTQTFTADTPVVQHYYPFSTMPIVSLHIPYHFVICDTGRKLNSVYGADISKMRGDFTQGIGVLSSIVKEIYDAWMRAEPAWNSEGSFDIALGDPSPGGPDDGSGHVGSGGPSSHGGPGQGTLGTAPLGRRAALQSSLAPGDSASCFGPAEDDDDDELHDVPQEDEDSDEEWEDPEWGAWLEAWVEDVWEATHAHASSPYHSQETLVGAPMPSEKVAGVADPTHLEAVDELSKRDVLVVLEHMDGAEVLVRSVPELEPQEVARIRRRRTAELNGEGGPKVRDGLQLRMGVDNPCLVEERDERLVGALDHHQLQRVPIERDPLERLQDRAQRRAARDVADATHRFVGIDRILAHVGVAARLLDECRRETVRVRLVVDELRIHKVPDIVHVLHRDLPSEGKVPEGVEKRLRVLRRLLELCSVLHGLHVLFKRGAISPGLQRAVVARLNGLDGDVLVAVERCHDRRLVRERDPVRRVWREQTLEQRGRRIEHGCTLAADLHADVDLREVDEVAVDATDVRRGARV